MGYSRELIERICEILKLGFVNRYNKNIFSPDENIIVERQDGTPMSVTPRELYNEAKALKEATNLEQEAESIADLEG
ncbi:hypothetical protein D3C81_1355230 [compost metagenome]